VAVYGTPVTSKVLGSAPQSNVPESPGVPLVTALLPVIVVVPEVIVKVALKLDESGAQVPVSVNVPG